MRCLLMSIKQNWCELILKGEKTIEIRKSRPQELSTPFKCYIYCTKTGAKEDSIAKPGKVIGYFICDKIIPIRVFEDGLIQDWNWNSLEKSKVPYDDMATYIGHGKIGYGYQISNLKIYKESIDITEFQTICNGDLDSKCHKCKYYYSESSEDGFYEECMLNNIIPVTRPPQSWMYTYEEIPRNDKTIII